MSEAEQVYSSRQVAALLGLGAAMLRRYAVSYEQVTGSQLQLDRRDGRIFTQKDVDVLTQARTLVATQGLPVDTAIKTALSKPESAPKPLSVLPVANGEALAAVLTQAITKAQRPLLGELQSIKAELEALRSDNQALTQGQRELGALPKKDDEREHGPLVRFSLWLEQALRRLSP